MKMKKIDYIILLLHCLKEEPDPCLDYADAQSYASRVFGLRSNTSDDDDAMWDRALSIHQNEVRISKIGELKRDDYYIDIINKYETILM